MKVQSTLQFKIIHPNRNKALSLNTTMRQYRKCINFYLHEIARGASLTEIYQQAKKQYNLQTALIQTARDIAKEQYQSYKNNEGNSYFPHFDSFIQIRYDKRAISFKRVNNHFEVWGNSNCRWEGKSLDNKQC